MIEVDLRAFLLADTAIAALISDRIFAVMIPQGSTLPAIAYQRIATGRGYHLQGQGVFAEVRTQLSIWADTLDDANAIAELIRLKVSGYIGTMGSDYSHGIDVVSQAHDSEPDTGRYRAMLDLRIWHAETVPA